MKMAKPFRTLIVTIILIFCGTTSHGQQLRTIIDMDGRYIEVPDDPQRIACLHGVSADRIIMLGKGAALVLAMQPSPWAVKLYPELHNMEMATRSMRVGVEQLLNLQIDLVLYSPNPGEAESFRAAGLHTACGFAAAKRPRTLPAFFDDFKHQVNFFGELLGDETTLRAENYCRYFDNTMAKIMAITEKIEGRDRPRVYYGGRNNDLLATQGKSSVLDWVVQVAGGTFMPAAIDANFAEANFEQVLSWDPDVILLSGWGNNLEQVRVNPNWSALRAVSSNRLYLLPSGIFAWEYASGETVLLVMHLAKIFHPEAFNDLDMVEETVSFYREVYHKEVTPDDAERILKGLPPS